MMSERPARQLILDLARAPSHDADDFLVSPSNAQSHALVDRWPDWPERTLLLVGPAGAGKSHLAAIWRLRAGATVLPPGADPGALRGTGPLIAVVEDADRSGFAETELFHLVNNVKETGGWLLMTARKPPDQWGLTTPDLLSRLRLAAQAPIGRPDPALIRAVIVKLFTDRQIMIAEDVVAYAARHCEQSLESVNTFVAAIDDEALASGRRITRPLAARTLERLILEAPGDGV